MKDELNCSYDGGGVAYLLQSVAIHFNLIVGPLTLYVEQYRFTLV